MMNIIINNTNVVIKCDAQGTLNECYNKIDC